MRLSIEEPQTNVAEAPCQQPKLRQSDWLAAAAAVIETFYDPTLARDWATESLCIKNVGAVTVILFSFNRSFMHKQLLLTVGVMKSTAAIGCLLKSSLGSLAIARLHLYFRVLYSFGTSCPHSHIWGGGDFSVRLRGQLNTLSSRATNQTTSFSVYGKHALVLQRLTWQHHVGVDKTLKNWWREFKLTWYAYCKSNVIYLNQYFENQLQCLFFYFRA